MTNNQSYYVPFQKYPGRDCNNNCFGFDIGVSGHVYVVTEKIVYYMDYMTARAVKIFVFAGRTRGCGTRVVVVVIVSA